MVEKGGRGVGRGEESEAEEKESRQEGDGYPSSLFHHRNTADRQRAATQARQT